MNDVARRAGPIAIDVGDLSGRPESGRSASICTNGPGNHQVPPVPPNPAQPGPSHDGRRPDRDLGWRQHRNPSRLPTEVPDRMAPGATLSPQRTPRRLALATVLLFGITSVATLAAPAPSLAWDGNAYDSTAESQLVALTNRARADAGLKSLKVDSTLHSVARWRSKDMIDNDYFSHAIPGWGNPGVFPYLSSIGYCYKIAGENIGWNDYPDDQATAAIQQMFMDSAPHRSNILGTAWDVIGVGAYKGSDGKKMYTVLFADKCGATPSPTPKPTPKPTPRPTPKPTPHPTPNADTGADASPDADADTQPTPTPDRRRRPPPRPYRSRLRRPHRPRRPPTPTPEPTQSPSPVPAGFTLRVVERASSQSLLEMIVTGVTGFFFGG